MSDKKKRTVHIDKDLHKAIERWKVESDRTISDLTESLIKAGFESKREKLPSYVLEKLTFDKKQIGKKESRESGKSVELSDLPKNVIDLSKELDGGKVGSDETIQNITLACLRYLKAKGKAAHEDFKNDVYPKFKDNYTESSFWKVAKRGIKQIDEKSDVVNAPHGRGHAKYVWKGD